jgi:hypothetical protein
VECARQRRAVLRFGGYCFDSIEKKLNQDDFGLTYANFWKLLIRESSALSYRVEQLSYEEHLELLISLKEYIKPPRILR